ncbi:MAG: DUF6043 family protein [Prevotella sp.]|nr:DUF6043 family protein [Prevotella sp.]
MSKKENQEKFESFKAEVLKWRNEHLLECKMFEKRMYENDGAPLLDVYKDVMMLLPSMVKKWKGLSSQPSTYELNHLDELVEGSSLASKLINDFKLNAVPKAGIILSWIFYGDFYEVIVSINEKYANDKKNLNLIERKICAFVAKSAVKSSIKAGYRTKEQWDDYYRTSQMLEDGNVLGWIKADLDKDIETEKKAHEQTLLQEEHARAQQAERKAQEAERNALESERRAMEAEKEKAVAEAILKTKEEMLAQSLAEKEARAEKAEQLAMQENELRRKAEEDAEKQRLAREEAEATIKVLSEPPAPDVAPSDLEPKEKEDAEEYPPFSNILKCPLEKKEAVVNAIGEHIQENHTGWDLAYLNKALEIRGVLDKEDAKNATLYYNALIKQYPKLESIIPSLRTIQTYMSKLRNTTMGVGKKDMFERDEFRVELDKALEVIDMALGA